MWGDFNPRQGGEVLDRNTFNTVELDRLRYRIWSGVPYDLIKTLIVHLFNLDEDHAEVQYEEAKSRTSQIDPGRYSLTTSKMSAFLTPNGIMVMKDLDQMILFENKQIEVCFILPRVTQLLLWYLSEILTFSLLTMLVREQQTHKSEIRYFPTTESEYDEVYSQIYQAITRFQTTSAKQYFSEKQLRLLIKDMFDNLLVGYIKAEYFGCVLMVFLTSGISGIAQIIALLIASTASATLSKVDWTVEENFKSEFQVACKYEVDFIKLMESAHNVDLNSRQGVQLPQAEKPRFLPATAILTSPEQIDALLSALPGSIQSFHRVYQASARVLGELYQTWKLCIDPQLLLVRIDNATVTPKQIFCLYLDRAFSLFEKAPIPLSESMLIQLSPKYLVWRHVKEFRVGLSALSDLEFNDEIGCGIDSSDPFLVLSQELKFGIQRPSLAFGSRSLYYRDDFPISEVELFTVKQVSQFD